VAKLDTMRLRYATATPALIPEYERIAGAEPSRLLTFHAPESIDAMAETGHAAVRLGALRPLLVTDPRLIEVGWVDEMLGHLRAQCVDARVWSGLTPNPKDHEIAAGYALGTRTRTTSSWWARRRRSRRSRRWCGRCTPMLRCWI
jgi:alcohol dehydrogenase